MVRWLKKKKKKLPRMKCMNVMQMQTIKKKSFGYKRLKELTQGPCQPDSLRLSLLHPRSEERRVGKECVP